MSEHVTNQPHGHDAHGEHVTADGHGAAAAALPFSDAEWAAFQKSDVQMGAAVICLMAGIFTTGLILYSVILFCVS
jgi:hypothetical protein